MHFNICILLEKKRKELSAHKIIIEEEIDKLDKLHEIRIPKR